MGSPNPLTEREREVFEMFRSRGLTALRLGRRVP